MQQNDFLKQAEAMRDALIAKATEAANEWFQETLRMVQSVLTEKPPTSATNTRKVRRVRLNVLGRIRTFIASKAGKEFSSLDVRSYLAQDGVPMDTAARRATVSTLLSRMAARKEIDLVTQGKGSAPSWFRAKAKVGTESRL